MKKLSSVVLAAALLLSASPAFALAPAGSASASSTGPGSGDVAAFVSAHVGRRESAQDPEIQRKEAIPSPTNATARPSAVSSWQTAAPAASQSAIAPSLGPNLVPNPSFETVGAGGLPQNWKKGGYGTNTRVLSFPASPPHTGANAASVAITSYASGDAKWYFTNVAVEPGATYRFSDWYQATAPTEVDVAVTHASGAVTYIVLGRPAASAAYAQFSAQFTAPPDAASVTIYHVLNKVGSLTLDDYALQKVTLSAAPVNLVSNGDFETPGPSGNPANWIRGGYGTNTRTFSYPVAGENGSGAQVSVSNFTSGGADWAPALIQAPAGTYLYTDTYLSSAPTILELELDSASGTAYIDIAFLPAASTWAHASASFTVPPGTTAFRVFHLINQNGTLTIDNVSVTAAPPSGNGIFATGAVSFRFDDGIQDQYDNAAPILDAAGFKGTFYIVSQETADNGFPGYMSIGEIQNLYARGNEIGAHTRTHPHLTTLSAQGQQDEIAGSRQDILGWSVGPVSSFAYPFGEYDATTTQLVQQAGFSSAAATITGYVTPQSDHYQLQYQEVNNDTTLAQVRQWVDTAAQTHTWLILTFHAVIADTSNNKYSTTPGELQDIVNYVKQKSLPVVTVSQGMQSM